MGYEDTGFFTLQQARQKAAETHELCLTAAKRTRHTLIFSHSTLLSLMGMTLNLNSTIDHTKLHTTVASLNQKSQLSGIQVHVWSHHMETFAIDDFISGVTPEQAVCQMAPYVSQTSLTMAMDWLTCHHEQLKMTTHQALEEYLIGLRHFRGSAKCKAALERSVEGTDSPQETLLRLRLIDAGLPCPKVNFPIIDSEDHKEFLVDMAYPKQRIAIEYDGEYHYDKQRWRYDMHKRNRLQNLGWKVFVANKLNFYGTTATRKFITMISDTLQSRNSLFREFQ